MIYLAISIMPSVFTTESIQVETADPITYQDTLNVQGIALRDEILISAKGAPTSVDYKVNDGDRVSIGDTVAVYNDGSISTSDRMAVEIIDRKISLLNESISATSQYDLKTLDARTKDAITDFLNSSSEQYLSVARDSSTAVLSYLIKRNIKAEGDKSYYRQILKNCEEERSSILSGSSAKQSTVSASRAGYFSSKFDGYESITYEFWLKNAGELTPNSIQSLLNTPAEARPQNYVGKLQHFSDWRFLCTIPEEKADLFKVGSSWTLSFETAAYGKKTVSMTVAEISNSSDGKVALAFKCSFFDKAIYSLRICDAQIVLKSYSGFRVRKDSIRVSEGENGVYVLSGAKLIFKPITVLYLSDDSGFAVVAPAVKDSFRTLIMNDSVVIGGKDIYDGKVVNIN